MAERSLQPDIEATVAVVGGGPAGLAVATEIARRGVGKVLLLERDTVVGGIPRHCGHSPFGMREFHRILSGKSYAARLESAAINAGVEILTQHSVLSCAAGVLDIATPRGMRTVHAQRVVLATGIRETPRSAQLVSGDRPLGVMNTGALQAYAHLQHLAPFRRPVIVGTELVSMSAILTCLSAGIRPVAIIEARDRATARFPFRLLPAVLRIPVHYQTEIVDINGGPRVEEIVIERAGQRQTIVCDGVLFTGRFTPESSLARLSGVVIDRGSGGPAIDAQGRTSDPHIFATGNLLRSVETAGWCWAEGMRVAQSVVDDLQGRLLAPGGRILISAGQGIKLVVPQAIDRTTVLASFPSLQVRLDAPFRGRLTMSDGARIIWSKPIDSGPERRILIPIDELQIGPSVGALTVGLAGEGGK